MQGDYTRIDYKSPWALPVKAWSYVERVKSLSAQLNNPPLDMWNNRIIKEADGYGIFEVFYNEEGDILGYTEDPMTGYFETEEELRDNLETMVIDIKRHETLAGEAIEFGEVPEDWKN